jgi:hypothetical protein
MIPLRQLATTAVVLFAAMSATAAEEDPVLSRAAYAALLKADELADLKIGVRAFTDGSAMLWGSARPEDAAKAEAVLKKVPGITSVLNTCGPTAAPTKAKPAEGPVLIPTPGAPEDRPTTAEKKAGEPTARLLDPRPIDGPIDYATIDRVRRSDPRYARLTFDLRDGRVVIAGPAADPRAAWDLARQIAPLVGNRDVVVVRAK